ncbi:hypothetical protein JM16_008886, partial [Phytophthora kernoviae]
MTLEFPLHAPTPPISTLDDDDDDSDEQGEIDVDAEMEELLESLTASLQSNRQSRGKIRRRARDNLQTEVEFLRNKVQQMEEELRALRLEHLDNMAPVPAPSTPTATLAFSSQAFGFPLSIPQVNEAPPIWDLAARQQRWRQEAVKENAKLRMILNTQASLAKSMEAQLGKRIRQQFTSEGCTPDNLVAQSWSPSFALETETVDALQNGLDTAFNELDAVFAANGFVERVCVFSADVDGDSSSDTVMEMVEMKFTGKNTNADFHVKQAVRRYVEIDRKVVMWVFKAEAAENQISAYSSFAFVDKGY